MASEGPQTSEFTTQDPPSEVQIPALLTPAEDSCRTAFVSIRVKQETQNWQEGDASNGGNGLVGARREIVTVRAVQCKEELIEARTPHVSDVPFGPIFPLPMWETEKAFGPVCDFALPKGGLGDDLLRSQVFRGPGGRAAPPPKYKHLRRNQFVYRSHRQLARDEVAVCGCKYAEGDPQSACGEERCLNAMLNSECTPGHCPCGDLCLNQKFQRCQYANLEVRVTAGRGWGLFAGEDIKAGQFLVEYCGEVLSDRDVSRRLEKYAAEGEANAYILKLSGSEVIDATKKGSLGRFMNHSCAPNCITRKWNVLGEVRVGIFTAVDVRAGTELVYDYNFEWYGGEKVRCRCGAATCQGFLGSKSRAFQESAYLWDDDDPRYKVENVPTYDSEDEGTSTKVVLSAPARVPPGAQSAMEELAEPRVERAIDTATTTGSPVVKKRRTRREDVVRPSPAGQADRGAAPSADGDGEGAQKGPRKWPKRAADPIFLRPVRSTKRRQRRLVPGVGGGASVQVGRRLQAPLPMHLFPTEEAHADAALKQARANDADVAWEALRKDMRENLAALRLRSEGASCRVREFYDLDFRRLGAIFERDSALIEGISSTWAGP